MNVLTIIILVFSVLGGIDYIFGSKLGIGKEFEKGFHLFGPMSLSMLGMLVLAPAIGVWLSPVFDGFTTYSKLIRRLYPLHFLPTIWVGPNLHKVYVNRMQSATTTHLSLVL